MDTPSSSPDSHVSEELRQGSTDEVRGHREVSSERTGQPVSHEEEEILFPGLSCKTHSVMALTLLAGSQMVTTKCSRLDVAFNFRCPSGFSWQRVAGRESFCAHCFFYFLSKHPSPDTAGEEILELWMKSHKFSWKQNSRKANRKEEE